MNEAGIGTFALEWALPLRADIESEQRGERTNQKKWNTLSRKYTQLTEELVSAIVSSSTPFTGIQETWKEALQCLSQAHVMFIIIADSMSIIDWYSIKDKLNLHGFKKHDRFALSTIPTETPVGHASIFSGLRPSECGVTGRTFVDKNGVVYELATLEEEEEDDTLLKKGPEHEYRPEHLRQILASDSFDRKALVVSPFKGTRLTQTASARSLAPIEMSSQQV